MTLGSSELIVIVAIAFSFSTLIVVMFAVMRSLQVKKKYDHQESRALIELIRKDFEAQMYKLSEGLLANEMRWRDVNHLLLSSQSQKTMPARIGKEVILSEFLRGAGLTRDDLKVDNRLVFVLTPFHERYQSEFEVIRRVCQEVGLRCMRGDEEFIRGEILRHILKGIVQANIVVANIEGRNPNVFYELGLAHALDKSTILLAKEVENLPIDIKSKRIVIYPNLDELEKLFKDELLRALVVA